MQAITVSYLFMFLQGEEIGAGDIAASRFITGLKKYTMYYKNSHIMLTNIFNDLVNRWRSPPIGHDFKL